MKTAARAILAAGAFMTALPAEQWPARLGQDLEETFEHGPQTSGYLDALAAEVPDLRDGPVNVVLPVGGAVEAPYPARRVVNP